jgi:hypothetical protein
MPKADEADPEAPTGNLPSAAPAKTAIKKAATKAPAPVPAAAGGRAAAPAPVVVAQTSTADVALGVAAALIALAVVGYLFYIGATEI